MILIIIGVLFLLGLIMLHELGHFWAARRAGVEVEEFGLGFPPRARVLKVKNGTIYTLNWLPLGGFVKLKGEHDSDTTKGSFGAARLQDKVLIMIAGVVMNVLAAIVLLSVVAANGMPQVINGQFNVSSDSEIVQQDVVLSVIKDSPAENAGLESGDKLLRIAQVDCESASCQAVDINEALDLQPATLGFAGQKVEVTYARDNNAPQTVQVQLLSADEVEASRQTDQPKGYLGVVPNDYIKRQATWSAPIVGVATTFQFFSETLKGLGNLLVDLSRGNTETAKEQVTGVVGIGYVLGEISNQGFAAVLFLTAIISVSLAVMNILPIPALDGGRLFVTLLFRALRRPLTKVTEERIHGTGFSLLMLLFVLITVLDVQRFILD